MPSSISHSKLGKKIANAHGLTTQLVEALDGKYRYKKNIQKELLDLRMALSGLKSNLTMIYNNEDRGKQSETAKNPYYPLREQGFIRTEISLKLSPQEKVYGKTRLSTNDIDATLGHLVEIEACLDVCSQLVAGSLGSADALIYIERAFTSSHKAAELLRMISR